MGKYNLGKTSLVVSDKINKSDLYINEKKLNKLIYDMDSELDTLRKSLLKIQKLLNQSVNAGFVKGTRSTTFKSWARKAKSQSTQAEKLRVKLLESYEEDVKKYPVYLLDQRLAMLEEKINEMSNRSEVR